jgi:hypothetical protein
MMDFVLPPWIGPALTFTSAIVIPLVLYVRRLAQQVNAAGFASKADIDAVKKSMLDADKKLAAIEHDLEHAPSGTDMRALSDRLLQVEAALKQVPTTHALHDLGLKLERLAGAMEGHNTMQGEILNIVRRHENIIATAAARGQ